MPITIEKSNEKLKYHVDLVMCIDATGSMLHIIDEVKANALSFYGKFVAAMEAEKKNVQSLRIKVIAFRDFAADSEPLLESPFFCLGGDQEIQTEEFQNFVNAIEPVGGGDIPENSLEALAIAIKSDWVRTGGVRRHVIMMMTDAPALDLGVNSDAPGYPAGMPADLPQLRELWESQEMEPRAKRLLLLTPDTEPWTSIAADWTNAMHSPSKAGSGLSDIDMSACIHLLVKSI